MRISFHPEDQLGRLGGDEFSVFMPIKADLDNEEAFELIDKKCMELCYAFTNHIFAGNRDFRVSISAGVAVYPQNGSSFSALYKTADSALYTSKRKGKNMFTIYGEENK